MPQPNLAEGKKDDRRLLAADTCTDESLVTSGRTYGGTGQDPEESHLLHNVLDGQLRSRDKILEEEKKNNESSSGRLKSTSQLSDMNKMGILSPN